MRALVSLASIGTCLVSAWMAVMYVALRHPGYGWRVVMAAVICAGAASLLGGRPVSRLRAATLVWAVALAGVGIWALVSPAGDGWVIVAGALFVVEGVAGTAASLRA